MERPLTLESTIHLCLDMQLLFAPGSIWATPWMARVTPNIVRICEALAPRNVFTRFIPQARADEAPGMWNAFYRKWEDVTRDHLDTNYLRLIPELEKFTPTAAIFDKLVYSAFHDGRLHAFLQQKGVNSLIMTGAETDICVLSTTLDAVDYGYRVVLIEDALCSSSDTGHDALMTMYRNRLSLQIQLATTDDIMMALNG
jgi:nicotinamidase-related amidase